MVQRERSQRHSTSQVDDWEADEDDQYLVAADNFYSAKEKMIKSSNKKSDGLEDVYEFEPPVIENMPTAIGYHSEDSGDVMWEEKSRASRYTTNLGSIDEEDSDSDFEKDDRAEVEDTSTQDGFRDDDADSSHMDDRYAGYHRTQDENKNTQNRVVQSVWSNSTQSNGKPMWRSNSTNSFAAGEVKSSSTSFNGPARGSASQKLSHSKRSQLSSRPGANVATDHPPSKIKARASGSYGAGEVRKTPSSASKTSSKKSNGKTGFQHSSKSKKLAASRSSLSSSSSSKRKKPELHKKHHHVKTKEKLKATDSSRQVDDTPRATGLLALIRRKQSPENGGSMKTSSTRSDAKSRRSRSSSKRTSASKSSKSTASNRKKMNAPLQQSNSKSSKKDGFTGSMHPTKSAPLTNTPLTKASSSSQRSRHSSSSSRSNFISLNKNNSHARAKSIASGSAKDRGSISPTNQSQSFREVRPPEQQPTSVKDVGSDDRAPSVTTRSSSRHSISSGAPKEEPIETTPSPDWAEDKPKTTKEYSSGYSSSISSKHVDDAGSSGSLSLKPSKELSQKVPPPQHDDDWPEENNAPAKMKTQAAPTPVTALPSKSANDDPLLQIRANFSGSAVDENEAHEGKVRNLPIEADANAPQSQAGLVTNPPQPESEEKQTKESLFSILYRQHCSTFAACASTIDGIANVGVTERWSFLDWGVDCNKAKEQAPNGEGGAKDGQRQIEDGRASPRDENGNNSSPSHSKDYDHFEGFEHAAPKGIYSPSMPSKKSNGSRMRDFTNGRHRQASRATDTEAGNAETCHTVSPVHFVQSSKVSRGITNVTSKISRDKNGGQQESSAKGQLKNDTAPLSPTEKAQQAMKAGDIAPQSNNASHPEDLGEEAEAGIEHTMELHQNAEEEPCVTQEQQKDRLHQIPKTIDVDYPESIHHTISISSIEIPALAKVPTYQQQEEDDGSISILGLEKKSRKGSIGKQDKNRYGPTKKKGKPSFIGKFLSRQMK